MAGLSTVYQDHIFALIIVCMAKNHLHPPRLDFQIENREWVGAEESESGQPRWKSHAHLTSFKELSWSWKEACKKKNYWHKALKWALCAERISALRWDREISSLSWAVCFHKIRIRNVWPVPGRTSKKPKDNIDKEGNWGFISYLAETDNEFVVIMCHGVQAYIILLLQKYSHKCLAHIKESRSVWKSVSLSLI